MIPPRGSGTLNRIPVQGYIQVVPFSFPRSELAMTVCASRREPPTSTRHASAALLLFALLALPGLGTSQTGPNPGERIRIEMGPQTAGALGVTSPWEGTFIMVRQDALVASNPLSGGMALPLSGVQAIQVRRRRATSHALVRGTLAGTVFGVAAWRFLRVLCRTGCENGVGSAWAPALGSGLLVALLVAGQGPGEHWVYIDVPAPEPSDTLGAGEPRPIPWRNR